MPILIIRKKYWGDRRPCSDVHTYFVVCISKEYAFFIFFFLIMIATFSVIQTLLDITMAQRNGSKFSDRSVCISKQYRPRLV